MAIHSLINSFNGGEFSPLVSPRVQLEKYGSGCRILQNFIPLTYGGINRRPGTEFLKFAKNDDKRCRLLSFNYSTTTRFVLELGHLYLRIWKDGAPVLSGGDPLELSSPYTEAQLREVQFRQVNDIMYLTHPDVPQMKLSRIADDNWTFAEIDWTWPAFLDENISTTTLAVSHLTGTGRTMGANANVFQPGHVGSYWQIAHLREKSEVEKKLNTDGQSGNLIVLGDWEFTTYGLWTGVLKIQRSEDDGTTWETIRTYTSEDDRNVSTTGTEEKRVLLRIDYDETAGSGGRAVLVAGDARVYGVVKVTGYTSPTQVTVDIKKPIFATTATKIWAEGAWSAVRGYPRAIAFHEQRAIYAGTRYRPQTIIGSVIDDFENFRTSSLDDSAFSFQIAATEGNAIQWLESQDKLLIGTSGDEWTMGKSDTNEPITPTNIAAQRQSSYGSKYLRAILINDVTLFVQRQGRKVRELVYAFDKDGWVAPDLTILAEHITQGEIVEAAYQQQPDAIYWAVRGDGTLIGATYERDQKVVAWHRHQTEGEVESVTTIYGDGTDDEVWISVKRTLNGQVRRCIERFRLNWRQTQDAEDKVNWFYVDCGKQVTLEEPATEVPGFDYLEGQTVSVLSDGAVESNQIVTGGKVKLKTPGTVVTVGLPYVSEVLPQRLEMDLQDGTSVSRIKRISRFSIYIHKSLGGEFTTNGVNWDRLYSRDTENNMDGSPPTFTGVKDVYTGGGYSPSADIHVRQTQPLPLTLLYIVPRWDVTGD